MMDFHWAACGRQAQTAKGIVGGHLAAVSGALDAFASPTEARCYMHRYEGPMSRSGPGAAHEPKTFAMPGLIPNPSVRVLSPL